VTLAVALGCVASPLLASETPPADAGAQPPSPGALVVAGIAFLGLVILFIMIVVHKRSRKHKVEEPAAAEPEPESPEPDESEEAGPASPGRSPATPGRSPDEGESASR